MSAGPRPDPGPGPGSGPAAAPDAGSDAGSGAAPERLGGVDALAERVAALVAPDEDRGHGVGSGVARALVAIVGPPASGKTTLAAELARRVPGAAVVPMDGFHLDNALLDAAGTRAVKGAPHTFDAAGLRALLARLRAGESPVHVPVFDRAADLSRAAAASVGPGHRVCLVEGNWLLLDRDPWRALHALFDLSVALEVDEATLRERLVARWLAHGHDAAAALARAEANDLPNGRLVGAASVPATLRLAR